MPRAKKSSSNGSNGGANGMPEFVNCNLSDEQKDFVRANIPPIAQILSSIEELLADNYKLTVSYDDTTDCYAAYLIGKENQVTNSGLMLSAYAPVLNGVLAMLLYKHSTVLGGEWGSKSQGNNKNSWR